MSFLISQSEVDQFLSCQRKHYYGFGEKLQPRQHGEGLQRGILGHEVLAAYYSMLLETKALTSRYSALTKEITTISNSIISREMQLNPLNMTMLSKLHSLLEAYFIHYEDELDEWQILAVEQEFRLGDFPFKPDLIKRHKQTGKVVVVDHKFLYNFYSDSAYEIMPQLVKYVGALRKLGYEVHGAQYNMLRHRDNAKEKFRRVQIVPTQLKINTFLDEQLEAMERISDLRSLPREQWERKVLRTASSFNCQHCSFLSLCTSDLNNYAGRDLLVATSYEPNTYGYTDDIEGEIL